MPRSRNRVIVLNESDVRRHLPRFCEYNRRNRTKELLHFLVTSSWTHLAQARSRVLRPSSTGVGVNNLESVNYFTLVELPKHRWEDRNPTLRIACYASK